MIFREQLKNMGTCEESIKWVGNKTIEQAWKTCKNSYWMLWILSQTDLDLTDLICNIVEELLHLVPEEHRLACISAITAVRIRANKNDLTVASTVAATISANYFSSALDRTFSRSALYAAAHAASAVSYTAAYASADSIVVNVNDSNACYAIASAAYASYYGANAAAADAASAIYPAWDDYNYNKEKKKQCDIIRKHFTIDQVKEAFNKLVA